jgi:excisionase family DNA binding protein
MKKPGVGNVRFVLDGIDPVKYTFIWFLWHSKAYYRQLTKRIEMAGEERWVGVEDVATHLAVAKDSVYRWIDERRLPAHRVGRLFRFKLSEIDAWVRQDNGREKTSKSLPRAPSSNAQKSQSKAKIRSRKRSGNG